MASTQKFSQVNRLQALNTLANVDFSRTMSKPMPTLSDNKIPEVNSQGQIHNEKMATSSNSSIQVKSISRRGKAGAEESGHEHAKKPHMIGKKQSGIIKEGTMRRSSMAQKQTASHHDIDGSMSISTVTTEFRKSAMSIVSSLRFKTITLKEYVGILLIFMAFWGICIYNTSSLNSQFNIALHNMILVRKNLKDMFWMSTMTKDLGNINFQIMLNNRGLIGTNQKRFSYITKGSIPALQDEFNQDFVYLTEALYRYRFYSYNLDWYYAKKFTDIKVNYSMSIAEKATVKVNTTFPTWGAAFMIAYVSKYWNMNIKNLSFDSKFITDYSKLTGSTWTNTATASANNILNTDDEDYTKLTNLFFIYILIGTGASIALAGLYVFAQLLIRQKIIWIYKHFGKIEMQEIFLKKEQLAILKAGLEETLDLQDTGFTHFQWKSGNAARKQNAKDTRSRRPFASNLTCFGMLVFILVVFGLMQGINIATYVTLVSLNSRGSSKLQAMKMVRYHQRMGACNNNISGKAYFIILQKLGLKKLDVNLTADLQSISGCIQEIQTYIPLLQTFIDANVKKEGYDRLSSDFLAQSAADIVDYSKIGMSSDEFNSLCDGTMNRTLMEFHRWQFYTLQNLYNELSSYNSSTILSILSQQNFLEWDYTRRFFMIEIVVNYMFYAFDVMDRSLATDDVNILLNLLAFEVLAFVFMLAAVIMETLSSHRHMSICLSSLSLPSVHTYTRNMQLRTLILRLERM